MSNNKSAFSAWQQMNGICTEEDSDSEDFVEGLLKEAYKLIMEKKITNHV